MVSWTGFIPVVGRWTISILAKISGKTGLLYYQQLLSGHDKVHFPYNTSYPTYVIALCYHVTTRLLEIDGLLPLVSVPYGSCKPLLGYFPFYHRRSKLFKRTNINYSNNT